jgi:hypothetical protein
MSAAHKKLRSTRITHKIRLAVLGRPLIQLFPAQNAWKIRQHNPQPTLTLVSLICGTQTRCRDGFLECHAAIKLRVGKTRQNANAGFRMELVTLAGS